MRNANIVFITNSVLFYPTYHYATIDHKWSEVDYLYRNANDHKCNCKTMLTKPLNELVYRIT